jgi:hypothetical protein
MNLRAELLHSYGKEGCSGVVALAEALVLPFAQLVLSEPEQGLISVKFFFRAYVAQDQLSWVRKSTEESLKIFDPLLAQVLTELDKKTRRTRWLLATELMFQGLANMDTIMKTTVQAESRKNRERYIETLINFVAGGLQYSA